MTDHSSPISSTKKTQFSLALSLARKRVRADQGSVTAISWISLVGMGLGVFILIIVSSVMNGFERELKNRILNVIPHGLVQIPEAISDEKIGQLVKDIPGLQAWGRYRESFAVLNEGKATVPILVMGIEPEREQGLSDLPLYLSSGEGQEVQAIEAGSFKAYLGQQIAYQLGAFVGSEVTLLVPVFSQTLIGTQARFKRIEVAGILSTQSELDGQMIIMHQKDVKVLLREKAPLWLRFKAEQVLEVRSPLNHLKANIEQAYGPVTSDDWTRRFGTLFQSIQLEQRLIALMLMAIVLVAAFNIFSTIAMTVDQSRHEIAILRAIGISKGTVMWSFLFHGLIVGGVGISLGAMLGVVFALYMESIFWALEHYFGLQIFNAYFIHYLPSELHWDEVGYTVIFALTCCLGFSLVPSLKAAAMLPALVLNDRE